MAKKQVPTVRTGRLSVYFCYQEGFHGRLRPSHDTAATALGELTFKQVRTLNSRINKYISQSVERNLVKGLIPKPTP